MIRIDGYGQCPKCLTIGTESWDCQQDIEIFVCCNCQVMFDVICNHTDYAYGFYDDGHANWYYAFNVITWDEFGDKPYGVCKDYRGN